MGHIGCGLFVTGVDEADTVPDFIEGVEGGHDLDARQCEDRCHSFRTKLSDKALCSTHLWHGLFLLTFDEGLSGRPTSLYPVRENGVNK